MNGASLNSDKANSYGGVVVYNSPSYSTTATEEWTLDNMLAGPYSVQFRYAVSNAGVANRPMDLYINGDLSVSDYAFPKNQVSDYHNYNTKTLSQAVRVPLVAGTNKVKLDLGERTTGMPVLDSLFVSNLGYFDAGDATLTGAATL